jgi:hypothetical protein
MHITSTLCIVYYFVIHILIVNSDLIITKAVHGKQFYINLMGIKHVFTKM